MNEQTEFTRQVIRLIRGIPRGRVATYGLIAKLAGKPHGSRGVAWILHSSSKRQKLPWHRVVGSKGKISFAEHTAAYVRQKKLLEEEGGVFESGRINLTKFLWKRRASL